MRVSTTSSTPSSWTAWPKKSARLRRLRRRLPKRSTARPARLTCLPWSRPGTRRTYASRTTTRYVWCTTRASSTRRQYSATTTATSSSTNRRCNRAPLLRVETAEDSADGVFHGRGSGVGLYLLHQLLCLRAVVAERDQCVDRVLRNLARGLILRRLRLVEALVGQQRLLRHLAA